jgi:cobaltochelatase CobN
MFYEATLSDSHVSAFLYENNPAAFEAMKKKFEALHAAGLWISRRNSVIATFEGAT